MHDSTALPIVSDDLEIDAVKLSVVEALCSKSLDQYNKFLDNLTFSSGSILNHFLHFASLLNLHCVLAKPWLLLLQRVNERFTKYIIPGRFIIDRSASLNGGLWVPAGDGTEVWEVSKLLLVVGIVELLATRLAC